MSAKHTPGPWRVTARACNMIDVLHAVDSPGAITMALCRVQARQSWIAEAEANANLIAAAPDMLEALRKAVVLLAGACVHSPELGPNDTYEAVSAAIAKATGVPVAQE